MALIVLSYVYASHVLLQITIKTRHESHTHDERSLDEFSYAYAKHERRKKCGNNIKTGKARLDILGQF
jgi:hypothetical protein